MHQKNLALRICVWHLGPLSGPPASSRPLDPQKMPQASRFPLFGLLWPTNCTNLRRTFTLHLQPSPYYHIVETEQQDEANTAGCRRKPLRFSVPVRAWHPVRTSRPSAHHRYWLPALVFRASTPRMPSPLDHCLLQTRFSTESEALAKWSPWMRTLFEPPWSSLGDPASLLLITG